MFIIGKVTASGTSKTSGSLDYEWFVEIKFYIWMNGKKIKPHFSNFFVNLDFRVIPFQSVSGRHLNILLTRSIYE